MAGAEESLGHRYSPVTAKYITNYDMPMGSWRPKQV